MQPIAQDRARRGRGLPTSAWVVLGTGITVAIAATHFTAQQIDRTEQAHLAAQTREVAAEIHRRIEAYAGLLRGLRAHFAGSSEVTRGEFHDYVGAIDIGRNYPGVQAIQFARHVSEAERPAFERRVRADRSLDPGGYPEFAIHPPGPRSEYVAVEFNEPMAANRAALGHDQMFEARRREVMQRARASGNAELSAMIVLVQDGAKRPAFVIRLALYRGGSVPTIEPARVARYVGQLTGVFRFDEVVAGLLPPQLLADTRVIVHDMGPSTARHGDADIALAYFDSGEPAHRRGAGTDRLSRTAEASADVLGRIWRVRAERTQGSPYFATAPVTVLLATLGATACLFGLITTLARQREDAVDDAGRIAVQLEEREQQHRLLVDTIQEVVFQCDIEGRWVYLNPAWARLYGTDPQMSIGADCLLAVHPADREAVRRRFEAIFAGHAEDVRLAHRFLAADGTTRMVEVRAQPVGEPIRGAIGTIVDVTAQHAAQREAEHRAHHDALTGLPNRALLEDRLALSLEQARRAGESVAVLFIDLNGFKPINDAHGHKAGDAVLRVVAERLAHAVRSADTVARLGGDEFVVVLPGVDHPHGTARVIDALHAALAAPIELIDACVTIGASIGVASYPIDGSTAAALLERADAAMYQAKARRRVERASGNRRAMMPRAVNF